MYEPPGIIIPYVRFTPVQTLVGGGCLSFPKNPFHVTSMAYGQPVFDYCTRPRYDAAMKNLILSGQGDNTLLVCAEDGCDWDRGYPMAEPLENIVEDGLTHRREGHSPPARRPAADQNELHTFEPELFDDKHCATCWPFKRRKGHRIHATR